jgi:hypothetical protein
VAELDKTTFHEQSTEKLSESTSNKKQATNVFNTTNLCEIYAVCIYYLSSLDSRLVLASLECLQVLFRLMPMKFNCFLTNSNTQKYNWFWSRMPAFSRKSDVSLNNLKQDHISLTTSSDSLNTIKQHQHDQTFSSDLNEFSSLNIENADTCTLMERETEQDEESVPPKLPEKKSDFNEILHLICDSTKEKPVVNFVRLLVGKFLLNTDEANKLKSDKEVKVITKAIAFDCCIHCVELMPSLISKSIVDECEMQVDDCRVFIVDLINYIQHEDDKMRTTAFYFIAHFIKSVLIESNGCYQEWLSRNACQIPELYLSTLINSLMQFLRKDNSQISSNNICKKHALAAINCFLPLLVKSNYVRLSLEILNNILHLKNSTYNLVKCELVDLIASIDFKSLIFSNDRTSGSLQTLILTQENDEEMSDEKTGSLPHRQEALFAWSTRNIQEKVIGEAFVHLLASDDVKLRVDTAKSLTKFVVNMNFFEATSSNGTTTAQNVLLAHAECLLKENSANLFNLGITERDSFNLSHYLLNAHLLFASTSQQIFNANKSYHSPLNALSLNSSMPFISKTSKILNNTYIQPFYSLIKYCPSWASHKNSVQFDVNKCIEHNLNYLVPLLVDKLVKTQNRHLFAGCLETFDFLFQTYTPAIFYASNEQQLFDLLDMFTTYLRHPLVTFDIYAHEILLRLIGNIFCSCSWLTMKKLDKYSQNLGNLLANNQNQQAQANNNLAQQLMDHLVNAIRINVCPHSKAESITGLNYFYLYSFNNALFKSCTDRLYVHVMRMLCLIACVIDESSLPSNLTTNLSTGSTSVASTAQPEPTTTQTTATTTSTSSATTNSNRSSSPNFLRSKLINITESKSGKVGKDPISTSQTELPKTTNIYLGFFQNSSQYLKLYEILKSSYNSYKKSFFNSNDRFIQTVRSVLKLFAQLLESALGVYEIAPHLDEILLYLKVIFFSIFLSTFS